MADNRPASPELHEEVKSILLDLWPGADLLSVIKHESVRSALEGVLGPHEVEVHETGINFITLKIEPDGARLMVEITF